MRLINSEELKQIVIGVWNDIDRYVEGDISLSDIIGIIDDMPTIEPKPHWIPCSERLPKQGQEVICQCRASIIKVLKLDADGDWYQDAGHCYMRGFVIAWMPLPEVYQEGADE